MKKIILYTILLLVGIAIGYFSHTKCKCSPIVIFHGSKSSFTGKNPKLFTSWTIMSQSGDTSNAYTFTPTN